MFGRATLPPRGLSVPGRGAGGRELLVEQREAPGAGGVQRLVHQREAAASRTEGR